MQAFNLDLGSEYDEFEGLSESKGYAQATLTMADGRQFNVYFIVPERLAQDAVEEFKTKAFYLEENLVIVPSTDRATLMRAVGEMIDSGATEQLCIHHKVIPKSQ